MSVNRSSQFQSKTGMLKPPIFSISFLILDQYLIIFRIPQTGWIMRVMAQSPHPKKNFSYVCESDLKLLSPEWMNGFNF